MYLQQNKISKFEGLINCQKLEIVDLAMNKITNFEHIDGLPKLVELWINWNFLEDTQENKDFLKKLKLTTIYLADNPISNYDNYEQMLKETIPSL